MIDARDRLGATYLGDGRTHLRVWAPRARRAAFVAADGGAETALVAEPDGYHRGVVLASPETRYRLRLDDGPPLPDPCSRHQPEGVHGPSAVYAPAPRGDTAWHGLPLSRYVIYELHVGAFTAAGTFDAVIDHLDALRDLGVTAVELMPVAQFPGGRNWGYDGVFPYAAQSTYGGPAGLARLVAACHARGLAVVLDVVYNHLGPEGNVLAQFGPYFTDRYRTPWGDALNFDGAASDEVRAYFIQNALYWLADMGVDALRLDAVHAIVDTSPVPFLEELAAAVDAAAEALNRRIYLIAESDAGDARIVRSRELHGYGLHAQWNDDFHHALHALITGERAGYYADFGAVEQLAKALRDGYVFTGEYMQFRGRRHGSPSRDLPASRFVVFAQNHDQVGNRMRGQRLTAVAGFERHKVAAAAALLSPFLPLIFMGEEYAEENPFLYFVSHGDPALVAAVRAGRKAEFAGFAWQGEPPDPQAEATFVASRLDHARRATGRHAAMYAYYRRLLALRAGVAALALPDKEALETWADAPTGRLQIYRRHPRGDAWLCFHFSDGPASFPAPAGAWRLQLDSADAAFGGPGASAPTVLVGGAAALAGCGVAVYTGGHHETILHTAAT